MATWDERINQYFGLHNERPLSERVEDEFNWKVNVVFIVSTVALIISILVLVFIGACYECCCSKADKRKVTPDGSAAVSYHGFTDDMEMKPAGSSDGKS